MKKVIPLILSGGHGTRLWPISRASMPKQFIPFISGQSLFEMTLDRVKDPTKYAPPVIVCSKEHRFHIVDILKHRNINDAVIVCEPVGRNTAPALCAGILAAQRAMSTGDEDQFLMLPSDHYIPDTNAFCKAVEQAIEVVDQGLIATFGIEPKTPHTGFGYIKKGEGTGNGFKISSFKEKPDHATASAYLQSGDYLWNAGIFLARQGDVIGALEKLQPDILKSVQSALDRSLQDLGDTILDKVEFSNAPDVSFDHAVMEKIGTAWVMPSNFIWDDLGSWDALWDVGAKDQRGNVLHGDVVSIENDNTYLRSDKQLLCAVGVKDIIAVATEDAVVIMPRTRSEQIKPLISSLKALNRPELYQGGNIYRPWGHYEILMAEKSFKVLRILVLPGHRFSLHKHTHRTEHWMVVRGLGHVIKDQDTLVLAENESVYIPKGTLHRMENRSDEELEVIEVQSGDYLGEDDMIRIQDDYNRALA